MDIMDILIYAVYILIFPGLLFTCLFGLWLAGIDRKVVARMQKRKGPPILQPAWDFLKLLGKECIVPATAARTTFLAAPWLGLASLVVTVLFIPIGGCRPSAERRHGGHPLPADHTHAGHDTRRQRLRLALRGRGLVAHDGRHHELRAPADTHSAGRRQSRRSRDAA